jgi:phosphate transport system permease protein
MVFWIGGYRAFNSKSFGLPVGETALAGSVVLAIMAAYYYHYLRGRNAQHTACHERRFSLGASHWQTIYKVVIPYSASGITAGAILG